MTKRSFFRRAAAIIAAVTLAPEIAFNVRLTPPAVTPELLPMWLETSRWVGRAVADFTGKPSECWPIV